MAAFLSFKEVHSVGIFKGSLTQIWHVSSFSDLGEILVAERFLQVVFFLVTGFYTLPCSLYPGPSSLGLFDSPSCLSITLTTPSHAWASLRES